LRRGNMGREGVTLAVNGTVDEGGWWEGEGREGDAERGWRRNPGCQGRFIQAGSPALVNGCGWRPDFAAVSNRRGTDT